MVEQRKRRREGRGREKKRRGGRRKGRELREVGLVCLLSVGQLLGPGKATSSEALLQS